MKTHIFYQRNHKGQYYAGLTQTKTALLFITLIVVGVGTLYSLVQARSWDASGGAPTSDGTVLEKQEIVTPFLKHGENPLGQPCAQDKNGICDLTDNATKIRIYELTEKGTKQIKWYGKTKISPVTAYTSRVQETDASPCIAADGSDICKRYANGEKICASNDYKLGSVIEVQGLGKCVVADRMNKRYTGTGRVDWYMGMDLVSARKWGLRHVAVSSL